jgi:molybdopterin-guanine dinucleotide biosynthesis protein A
MGEPKALLSVPPLGTPLLAHMIRRLRPVVTGEVVVVANDRQVIELALSEIDAVIVEDAYPGTGTLGGIATGLGMVQGWAAVVACDMPLVSASMFALLSRIAAEEEGERWDAVVPLVGGYEEPLHALYHRRCLPAMATRLGQGERRVISFMDDVRTKRVAEHELREVDPELHSFLNANTPDEWADIIRLLL